MAAQQPASAGILTRPRRPFGDGVAVTASDGAGLREHRDVIRSNVAAGARTLLAEGPRRARIPPASHDPRYENLYDRALALIGDGAALEHLAIAMSLDRLLVPDHEAVRWITSIVGAWTAELGGPIDYGSAYALTRLHKGVAVAFETFGPLLTDQEARDVVEFLSRMGDALWDEWFSRPPARGPIGLEEDRHSPHHSSVEWSAFGVVSLVLLGHTRQATTWLDATIEQFADVLLPDALGVDGSPVEGVTLLGVDSFWSSTMFSRIQFLDALSRLTGRDLGDEYPASMNANFARALCRRVPDLPPTAGEDRLAVRRWPLLPRAAGGVLCWLAAKYGDPELQRLAEYDRRAGALESSFVSTPTRRIRWRNVHNSYAAVWHEPELPARPPQRHGVFCFPTLGLGVSPAGFDTGQFAVAIDQGRVIIWFADTLVFQDFTPERVCVVEASQASGTPIFALEPAGQEVTDVGGHWLGTRHFIQGCNAQGETVVRVEVDAADPSVSVTRTVAPGHRWRSEYDVGPGGRREVLELRNGRRRLQLTVPDGIRAVRGRPAVVQESVGYGLLELHDESDYTGLRDHQLHVDAPRPATLIIRPAPGSPRPPLR